MPAKRENRLGNKQNNNKAPSGRPAEWCFASSACRQIGFFAFGPK
jgi:hypothetical protein